MEISQSLITSLLSGAGSSTLVGWILFMLWKRSSKDWETTNKKLDKNIIDLTSSINSLSKTMVDLKVEVAKSNCVCDLLKENITKIEAKVFS